MNTVNKIKRFFMVMRRDGFYKQPVCLGSNPSYQEQAENDCNTCPYYKQCVKENER